MTLAHLVMVFGAVIVIFCIILFVLWRGSDPDARDNHIKFLGLEFRGNSVIAVMIVGVFLIIIPLIKGPTDAPCVIFCLDEKAFGWAYFGSRSGTAWGDHNFALSDGSGRVPRAGDLVTAQNPVNIRSGPIQHTAIGWQNQASVGAAKNGDRFRVRGVLEVDPGFFWIEIAPSTR